MAARSSGRRLRIIIAYRPFGSYDLAEIVRPAICAGIVQWG
jgi:hypothetical protein